MKNAGILQGSPYEHTSVQLISGSTVADYANKYNATIGVSGKYAGFTGSIKSTFGDTSTLNSTTAFASVIGHYNKYLEKINASSINVNDLSVFMTDKFKSAVNSIDADTSKEDIFKFFSIYGTHIITGAYHGGYLSYSKSSSSTKVTDSKQFGLAVSAGYSSATGNNISTDDTYDSSSDSSKAAQSESAKIEVRGGDSVYITYLQSGLATENFTNWLAGFSDQQKWDLCGFTSGNAGTGLYPITEFFSDPNVKAHVLAIYNEYEKENSFEITEDTIKPTYKVTLDYSNTNDNFLSHSSDAGSSCEFYGTMNVRFKETDYKMWDLADDDEVYAVVDNNGEWTRISGGNSVSLESQNLEDKFQVNINLKEDDGSGSASDDDYEVYGTPVEFSFNDIREKFSNDVKAIIITLRDKKDNDDTVEMRITIKFEQYCKNNE